MHVLALCLVVVVVVAAAAAAASEFLTVGIISSVETMYTME